MDYRLPADPNLRASNPPADSCPGLSTLIQFADTVFSIEAVERMVLAYAVHRHGLGFERAHLLVHDAAADQLVAWTGTAAPRDERALAEAVARAGLAPSMPEHEHTHRQVRWPAQALEGLAHLAWESEPVALAAPEHHAGAEGAVLLRGADRRYGLLVGGWEDMGDLEARREQLERFQAAVRRAITNFEQRRDARRAEAHLEALAGISRAAVSSLNVAEVLHLAVETVGGDPAVTGAAVWIAHGPETLKLEITHGPAVLRERAGRALSALATAAWSDLRARWIDQPEREPLLAAEWAEDLAAIAVLPLVAYGRAYGALVVYARREGRPAEYPAFASASRRFLTAVSDHVALALDQADRGEQHQRTAERERALRAQLQRIEPIAEYGQSAARGVQELRHPVASILAFARRAHGMLGEGDANREYLEIVLREAERLDAMVASAQAPPPPRAASFERVQPNELIQGILQRLGERLVRRRVRLVKKLSAEVPALLLDAERVREAIDHLLHHAVESVALGGRLKIESRKAGGHVVIEIAHDGLNEPGAALDQLFAAFASNGHSGAPNLAAAERIVREHGGEIRTRREGEWSTVIAFTLPIRDNQDRRRPAADRRHSGHERRMRFPEAAGG